MQLTQQGITGAAQNLPAIDNQVDTGPMGDCVSVVVLWNLNPANGQYQNVRGFHGSGGFGAVNMASLLNGVPNAAATQFIALLGTLASPASGSQDRGRVTAAHAAQLPLSTLQIFQDHGSYTVSRNGAVVQH
jgi:hypothetical protein